jgi:hypothetical protein
LIFIELFVCRVDVVFVRQDNSQRTLGVIISPTIRTVASKRAMQCKRSHERNQRISAMDSATRVVPNGNAEDCDRALTRYCAATGAAMLLDEDPKEVMLNVTEFCNVSDERKGELRSAWN